MKRVRIWTGDDGESHFEEHPFDFTERNGVATFPQAASQISFLLRKGGAFLDFHPAPRRQYVIYLTAEVEIAVGDGSKITMHPGDVLQAEDTTGRGHTSNILRDGVCAFVPLID